MPPFNCFFLGHALHHCSSEVLTEHGFHGFRENTKMVTRIGFMKPTFGWANFKKKSDWLNHSKTVRLIGSTTNSTNDGNLNGQRTSGRTPFDGSHAVQICKLSSLMWIAFFWVVIRDTFEGYVAVLLRGEKERPPPNCYITNCHH